MIVVSYGITKSGSTLAFELLKGLLVSAGHDQSRLKNDRISHHSSINFVQRVTVDTVYHIMNSIDDGKIVAIKTHGKFPNSQFVQLQDLVKKGQLAVQANCRDPRDICLSMLDAGRRANLEGRKAFSELRTIADCERSLQRQTETFRSWGAIEGALRLEYSQVVRNPHDTLKKMSNQLRIRGDENAAVRHAFEDAFTQKNKAVLNRYKTEMSTAANRLMSTKFSDYIENAVQRDNQCWFSERRDELTSIKSPRQTI